MWMFGKSTSPAPPPPHKLWRHPFFFHWIPPLPVWYFFGLHEHPHKIGLSSSGSSCVPSLCLTRTSTWNSTFFKWLFMLAVSLPYTNIHMKLQFLQVALRVCHLFALQEHPHEIPLSSSGSSCVPFLCLTWTSTWNSTFFKWLFGCPLCLPYTNMHMILHFLQVDLRVLLAIVVWPKKNTSVGLYTWRGVVT